MNNKTKILLILCVSLVLNAFPTWAQNELPNVSLLQVLADPDKYDGKELQLIGYLHLEFEGNGLYPHKEDYDHAILWNMIWINSTEAMEKQKNSINDKYVIIRGTFNSKEHGHMGLFSGTLSNITRCEAWPQRVPKKISAYKLQSIADSSLESLKIVHERKRSSLTFAMIQ